MSIVYVVLRFCSYVLVFDVKVYMSRVWAGGSNLWIAWEEEKKPHIMHISYKILCCPAGLRPVSSGPPLCPCLRSTNIAPFVTHSHSGRKWLHTQRMNQHHQTTTPFSSGQRSMESWGSQSVCVWNVCEVSLWSLVSGGQFEWLTYLRERFCGMSGMCVCKYVLFLSVCVCVYALGQVESTLLIISLCYACVCQGGTETRGVYGFCVCVIRPSKFPFKSCMTSFGMTTQNNDGVRPLASFRCHDSYWKTSSSERMRSPPPFSLFRMHVCVCVQLCNWLLVKTCWALEMREMFPFIIISLASCQK